MENNSDETNNMDESIFEQINRSLLDMKDKPADHNGFIALIDQVIQMNTLLHNRLTEYSTLVNTHAAHLDSHSQHLQAHDTHLAALTQRIELLNRP